MEKGGPKPVHWPVGADGQLVNEVNSKRQFPIGSEPWPRCHKDVNINMSRGAAGKRVTLRFTIHSVHR